MLIAKYAEELPQRKGTKSVIQKFYMRYQRPCSLVWNVRVRIENASQKISILGLII